MSDLEDIRQDYLRALEELTGNQKPIITNLTVIAEENRHAAKAITRAIEERISKVSREEATFEGYGTQSRHGGWDGMMEVFCGDLWRFPV